MHLTCLLPRSPKLIRVTKYAYYSVHINFRNTRQTRLLRRNSIVPSRSSERHLSQQIDNFSISISTWKTEESLLEQGRDGDWALQSLHWPEMSLHWSLFKQARYQADHNFDKSVIIIDLVNSLFTYSSLAILLSANWQSLAGKLLTLSIYSGMEGRFWSSTARFIFRILSALLKTLKPSKCLCSGCRLTHKLFVTNHVFQWGFPVALRRTRCWHIVPLCGFW